MAVDWTRDCWFLAGPTASGKTRLGLELAERIGGEIVSLDSMAIFRQLDIGTAKPTAAERARVPHHLVDIVEPDQDFSLAEYFDAAAVIVRQIGERGRVPLFVGGTPLYLKALLRGIFDGPPADWEFRRQLEAEASQQESGWLHAKVEKVDPPSAAKLHPQDTRRLIRALEVFEKTGQPISHWQQQFDQSRPAEECRVVVLDWPRAELYRRIDQRVEAMFAAGLIDEVRTLLDEGITLSRTASQAVGYRETLEHLAGDYDLPATIERVKIATHRFARRQLTWFRSLSECRWITMAEGVESQQIVAMILQHSQ